MKILFFLLLSFNLFAQHYSGKMVIIDNQIVSDEHADIFFKIQEPTLYIFDEKADELYSYEVLQKEIIDDMIIVHTLQFLLLTQESKEIIIITRYLDNRKVEIVYHNNI